MPIDITLCSIVIPICYIVKTEQVKKIVVSRGWWRYFTDFLPSCRARVLPAENVQLNCMPNENVVGNQELEQGLQEQQIQRTLAHPVDQDDERWWMNIDLFDEEDTQRKLAHPVDEDDESWWMNIDLFDEED